jgi:hypothetical protein
MTDTLNSTFEKPADSSILGLQRKMFIGGNWKCNGTTGFVKEYVNSLLNDLKWD